MTIWILAIVLMASAASLGHRQGVIRVAFSLVGILVAAMMSPSLGTVVKKPLIVLGVSHPFFLWLIGPFVAFTIVLIIFKAIGFFVHHKVYVYYKYQAGDLRFALWERLIARLGMCLGLVNGLLYFVIISWVVYSLGYWTVQVAPSDTDARIARIMNRMSWDLEKTGMNKAVAAVDKTPAVYFEVADVAGLIVQNTLLEARLSRYPGFLSLGERSEFMAISQDTGLMELRLRGASMRELLNHPLVDQLIRNPDTVNLIWNTVVPNLQDITNYLVTARSPKYDSEPLLGKWSFNAAASILVYRREKPNIPSSEVQRIRQWLAERFEKTALVAAPDHQVFLKQFPPAKPPGGAPASVALVNLNGQWKGGEGSYIFTTSEPGDERTARLENGKLIIRIESLPVVFNKEE